MYRHIHTHTHCTRRRPRGGGRAAPRRAPGSARCRWGVRSVFKISCFCGLDPGNFKFWTVRTKRQHICF